MEALTADPPPQQAQPPVEPAGDAANGHAPAPATAPEQPAAAAGCARCGSPLAAGQDWCLQCGAGAPGSLGTPAWRSAGIAVAAAAILVLGAAAAGYAALSKDGRKARVLTTTVAAVTPPAAVAPPATTLPATPTVKAPLAVKPPKIPLTASVPKAIAPPVTPSVQPKATTTPTTPSSTGTGGSSGEESSKAIVLDTNAASSYNPYNYPPASFGDPSLAIDGDSSTGWTAPVQPATAPKMAEGLLIDLKSPQRLAAVTLITSTPGMRIQVYGSAAAAAPTSITDPAWVPLSHSMPLKKRHQRIPLRESKHAFRFVTVWISSVPSAAVGTPQAPGHATIDELELFAA